MVKQTLTEDLNEQLRPIRQRRKLLEQNPDHIRNVLNSGIDKAREMADQTLREFRKVMNMEL